jgi:hypothetical protein
MVSTLPKRREKTEWPWLLAYFFFNLTKTSLNLYSFLFFFFHFEIGSTGSLYKTKTDLKLVSFLHKLTTCVCYHAWLNNFIFNKKMNSLDRTLS